MLRERDIDNVQIPETEKEKSLYSVKESEDIFMFV